MNPEVNQASSLTPHLGVVRYPGARSGLRDDHQVTRGHPRAWLWPKHPHCLQRWLRSRGACEHFHAAMVWRPQSLLGSRIALRPPFIC